MVENNNKKIQIENKGWFKQAYATNSPEAFPLGKNLQLNIIFQMISSDAEQLKLCGCD